MKLPLLFSLAIVVLAGSCVSNKASNPAPVPSGTFSGTFKRIHINALTGKKDTVSANLSLAMALATGFQVTGDTSVVHAGSYGDFSTTIAATATYIQFADLTYSSAHPGTKYHLNGLYQYQYDGTTFQLLSNSSDTLSFQYNFKKNN